MSNIWSRLVNLGGLITGTLGVGNGGTGLTSGTSGGILGFTASGTLASSGALTQYGIVYGGGAGATPAVTAADSNTAHVLKGGSPPSFAAIAAGDLPVAVTGTSAGAIAASGVPGNVTGSAVAAGYVGQMIGTQASGTNGSTYKTASSTDITNSASSVLTVNLNIGIYLASATLETTNAGAGGTQITAQWRIGGTAVSTAVITGATTGNANAQTITMPAIPVTITADGTALAVYAVTTGNTTNTSAHALYVVRIA